MHRDGEIVDASAGNFDLYDYGAGGFPTFGGALGLALIRASEEVFLLCSIELWPRSAGAGRSKALSPGQSLTCAEQLAQHSAA
jgi:hypothetical protein